MRNIRLFAALSIISFILVGCTVSGNQTGTTTSSSSTTSTVSWCVQKDSDPVCVDNIPMSDGQSVYDTLVTFKNRGGIEFKSQDYGGELGQFVTEVNGIAGDNSNFWKLFINDNEAQTGISAIIAKSGDKYLFRYEKVQPY